MNESLLIPDREMKADRSQNFTEVRLGEPMSFVKVTDSSLGAGLRTGAKPIAKAHPSMGASSQKLKTGSPSHKLWSAEWAGARPF